MLSRHVTLCAVLFSLTTTVSAGEKITDNDLERMFGESAPYRHVFEQVQITIQANDREKFARLVHYPFTIYRSKDECCGAEAVDLVENHAEFVERYDEIVTPAVRDLVLAQKFDDLFFNWRGLGFDLGVLWITGYCVGPDEADPCTDTIVGVKSVQTHVTR